MAMRHMRIWRYVDEVARSGSIRRAAERLNVTPSAVQRRIQDVEEDLGAAIFERSAQGVRLTAAGETVIRWIRAQAADLERVQSQIEDLAGLRRGHVRVACSQALVHAFLPREIAAFRRRYPLVSFQVMVRDHGQALQALVDFEADLAIAFRPPRMPEFQPLMSLGQRLVAIMAADHPLAARETVRLRDCAAYPVALADRAYGGRQIIDDVLAAGSARLSVELESNSFEMLRNFVRDGEAITFQIEIGAPRDDPGLAVRPVDDRDLAHGPLVLGQLRGRALPVAAAKFAHELARRLDAERATPMALSPSISAS
ncbi:MAG TPA: LysR family transcriptional regulator [Salinarimonas sp.]|jgi:DNA-binding transcriptional LysR family regulator|nr:LysR family transcriptional regulator [Salinarimonas sp.]